MRWLGLSYDNNSILIQVQLRAEVPSTSFDPTGPQTHDLQIMTAHFMSLRRLL